MAVFANPPLPPLNGPLCILLSLLTLVPIAGLFLDKPLPYIPSITLSAGPRCILFSSEEKRSHSTYN